MGKVAIFNKEAAMQAGMLLSHTCNGSNDAIAKCKADPTTDPDYLEWLQEESMTIVIPTIDGAICNADMLTDELIETQGNDWGFFGRILKPWLEENNISYDQV